jgi:hypothetical protein
VALLACPARLAFPSDITRILGRFTCLTDSVIVTAPWRIALASMRGKRKRQPHEGQSRRNLGSRQSRQQTPRVAEAPQYAREGGGGASESPARAGEPVHGVREPAGQYRSPQDPDGGAEGQSELGSTHEFETAEGRLSYQELSERLAVPLVAIYDELLQESPKQLVINSEWLCFRHKRLAGHLFPDWAGRFRDVNVQVGSHTPPPFYEVPIHMRHLCDDLRRGCCISIRS